MDKTQIDYEQLADAEVGTLASFQHGEFGIMLCKITPYSWHCEIACYCQKNADILVTTNNAITNMEVFCLLEQLGALDIELTGKPNIIKLQNNEGK